MGTGCAKHRPMLGERLRERVEELIANYVARMRNDPAIPKAKTLARPLLEDHAMSFCGDLFQSIVLLEKSEQISDREESLLMRDGSYIQRLIAELHGRQRYRMGWTAEALRREYEILDEELATLVKKHASAAGAAAELDWALAALRHMLKQAHDASFAAFGAAQREGEGRAKEEESFRVSP